MGGRLAVALALALSAAGVGGCSSGDNAATSPVADGGVPTFPDAPLSVQTSESGKLRLEIRSAPVQPPTLGSVQMDFAVLDAATGAPQTGLSIGISPWMPAMNHGMSVTPMATETSPGHYLVEPLSFFMPGIWELRTEFRSLGDHAIVSFDVP